jgi:hypothetical protein
MFTLRNIIFGTIFGGIVMTLLQNWLEVNIWKSWIFVIAGIIMALFVVWPSLKFE